MKYLRNTATDPHFNMAFDEYCLGKLQADEPVFYLWQNRPSVIIGLNQNPFAEVDIPYMEAHDILLARRVTGGGAVYHDLGNLNFTFVTTAGEYDQDEQTGVILDAVRSLGIAAERTGRNDLVVDGGRKFSGHAYQHTGAASCHHGTIMVAVDVDALGRYLTVSPLKLQAKGVRSVRSRVTNLRELNPGLMVAALKDALRASFANRVGGPVTQGDVRELDQRELARERERFCSRAWLYKGERRFGESRQSRFGWGSARVDLTREDGVIRDLVVFSDGLEAERIEAIPGLLVGAKDAPEELVRRLRAGGFSEDVAADVARLVAG